MKTISLLAGACLALGSFVPCARANPALPLNLADFLVPSAAAPACRTAGGFSLAEPPFATLTDGADTGCPRPSRRIGSYGGR